MLPTIQVEIDANGYIHSLETLPFLPVGRALLTLLEPGETASLSLDDAEKSTAAHALALLDSPRFRRSFSGDPGEVQRRIAELREDWRD